MGLNKIKSDGSWGNAAADINSNFDTIGSDLQKVKNATTKNKGYFSSSDKLLEAYPFAHDGDIAYVKQSGYTPFERWRWNGTAWEGTGESGGNDNVTLGDYYNRTEVDNKIEDTEEVISELNQSVLDLNTSKADKDSTDASITALNKSITALNKSVEGLGNSKAGKEETDAKLSELGSEIGVFKNTSYLSKSSDMYNYIMVPFKKDDILIISNQSDGTMNRSMIIFDEQGSTGIQIPLNSQDKEIIIPRDTSYIALYAYAGGVVQEGNVILTVNIKDGLEYRISNLEKEADEISNINKVLDVEINVLEEDSFKDGFYRNFSGVITKNSSYFITEPIWLTRGSYINITESMTVTNKVSLISRVDSDGNFIETLLNGTGDEQSVKVFISTEGYYEISSLKSVKSVISIGCIKSLSSVFKSVEDSQKEIENIKLSYYINTDEVIYKKSLIIDYDGVVQSVSSPAYKIGYYAAKKNLKIKVTFEKNNNYIYSGVLCKTDSVDNITEGGTLDTIYLFSYGQKESIEISLNEGETIAISCVQGSIIDEFSIQEYNPDTIRDIERELDDIKNIKNTIPTDYIGGDFSTFTKILCIGDSLTQGVFNYDTIEGQSFSANKEYSYPSNLKRISGCETINLGVAGITSSGWYNKFIDDERIIGCDCCIIALGVNDDRTTLETISRDAFINIIELVKNKNKGIKIFLSGIINGKSYSAVSDSGYKEKDQFIRNLYNELYANDVQVFFIDMVKYGHLQNLESMPSSSYPIDNYNMGHLSAYGYWRLAKDFYNYISYIMANDKNNVFRNIQFIGTDFYFKIP